MLAYAFLVVQSVYENCDRIALQAKELDAGYTRLKRERAAVPTLFSIHKRSVQRLGIFGEYWLPKISTLPELSEAEANDPHKLKMQVALLQAKLDAYQAHSDDCQAQATRRRVVPHVADWNDLREIRITIPLQ